MLGGVMDDPGGGRAGRGKAGTPDGVLLSRTELLAAALDGLGGTCSISLIILTFEWSSIFAYRRPELFSLKLRSCNERRFPRATTGNPRGRKSVVRFPRAPTGSPGGGKKRCPVRLMHRK